jgi:polyhydroxyalkanoate synthase
VLKDVAHLVDGMSSQVSKQVFEVGRNLAVTPGSVVLRHPLFELFQYALKNDLQVVRIELAHSRRLPHEWGLSNYV